MLVLSFIGQRNQREDDQLLKLERNPGLVLTLYNNGYLKNILRMERLSSLAGSFRVTAPRHQEKQKGSNNCSVHWQDSVAGSLRYAHLLDRTQVINCLIRRMLDKMFQRRTTKSFARVWPRNPKQRPLMLMDCLATKPKQTHEKAS